MRGGDLRIQVGSQQTFPDTRGKEVDCFVKRLTEKNFSVASGQSGIDLHDNGGPYHGIFLLKLTPSPSHPRILGPDGQRPHFHYKYTSSSSFCRCGTPRRVRTIDVNRASRKIATG